jgi:hypothetical protein
LFRLMWYAYCFPFTCSIEAKWAYDMLLLSH